MKNNDPDNFHKNLYDVKTHASGPTGRLPLQPDFLTNAPSGNVFGWTQGAAMGWSPSDLGKDEYLILSTSEDGSPIALGYHTGHWEVGLLAQAHPNIAFAMLLQGNTIFGDCKTCSPVKEVAQKLQKQLRSLGGGSVIVFSSTSLQMDLYSQ